MGALFSMLPQLLSLMNNPTVVALLPLLQQVLAQIGAGAFPNVDPAKAGQAGAALFDSEHVKWVQTALMLLGYSPRTADEDGVLGDSTKAAVLSFQGQNGLVADSWPGPKTNEALRTALLKTKP